MPAPALASCALQGRAQLDHGDRNDDREKDRSAGTSFKFVCSGQHTFLGCHRRWDVNVIRRRCRALPAAEGICWLYHGLRRLLFSRHANGRKHRACDLRLRRLQRHLHRFYRWLLGRSGFILAHHRNMQRLGPSCVGGNVLVLVWDRYVGLVVRLWAAVPQSGHNCQLLYCA